MQTPLTPPVAAPRLTPHFVYNSLGLKHDATEFKFTHFLSVTTDSRQSAPGQLFIALKGDRYDGHNFVRAAIEQGARGIIVSESWEPHIETTNALAVYRVADSVDAYRKLAAAWRRQFNLPVLAVAGSVGKTTTKELLASILTGKYGIGAVLKTEKSNNGFIGIPMTLLELAPSHQVAVIEVGIDEVGAMEKHMEVIFPHAAVITAIGAEHLEFLKNIETVAREELKALYFVQKQNMVSSPTLPYAPQVAVNLDDPWTAPLFEALSPVALGFQLSEQEKSSDRILVGQLFASENKMNISGGGLSPFTVPLPLPGKHNARNLLAAIALALSVRTTSDEIIEGLKNFTGSIDGRSEYKILPGPVHVICDYYNAQPTSVRAGLDLLHERKSQTQGNAWACLGDMLEMGTQEEALHRNLASQIIELGLEHVFLYGPRMKNLMDELVKRNFMGQVKHFLTHSDLASDLIFLLNPKDTVLIKGSRGMKMEEVWKYLELETHKKWPSP